MSLYRLDTSIRVQGSHSRAIADIVKQEWRRARPGDPVIRRHVGVDPIPATAWATAVFAGRTPPESLTEEQQAARCPHWNTHQAKGVNHGSFGKIVKIMPNGPWCYRPGRSGRPGRSLSSSGCPADAVAVGLRDRFEGRTAQSSRGGALRA
jgi:hypothetical protein